MIHEYLLYYLFLLTVLISANVIGKIALIVINSKPEQKFYRIFLELVFGVTFLIVLYSIVKTRLLTVNLLFVFVFITYFFFIARRKLFFPGRKNLYDSFRHLFKDVFYILIPCSLPFFLFEVYYLYSSSGIIFPHVDYFFYSELSGFLNYTGQENLWASINSVSTDQFKEIQPYHYFELWWNALISKTFHSASISSLLLISYPSLNSIVFIGFAALWESNKKISFWSLIIILFLLLTNGVYFKFFNNIIEDFGGITSLQCSLFALWGKKYSPVYIFFVLFLLLFIKEKNMAAFTVLACLLIVSAMLIPAVFSSVFVFLLLNKFHHTFSPKDNRKLLFFYSVIPFLFFILYFILGSFGKSSDSHYLAENFFLNTILSDYTEGSHYKYMFGMMTYRFLRYYVVFLPYIIIAFITLQFFIKTDKQVLRLLFLVMLFNIAGLLTYGFTLDISNSWQFFSTTFIFINCLLIIIFIKGFNNLSQSNNNLKKWGLRMCLLMILLLNGVNLFTYNTNINDTFKIQHTDSYINSVLSETSNQPFIQCAALYSEEDYKNNFYEYLFCVKPGRACQLGYGYKNIININNYFLFDTMNSLRHTDKYYLQNSAFYLFTKKQKEEKTFLSFEKSQIDFIDAYNIKYLFASEGAVLSEIIQKRINKKNVDPLSGEQFYILSGPGTQ